MKIRIHIHSVAGGTCLVDFIYGNDYFTHLLSTSAAGALLRSFELVRA